MVKPVFEAANVSQSPVNLARFDHHVNEFRKVLDKSVSLKHAIEGVLLDKNMQAKSLMFMRHVTVFMLRMATGEDYKPEKTITLPLSDQQPEAFRFLPEYALEDIVGNFNFLFR